MVLLGICLLAYVPNLELYPGYTPLSGGSIDDTEKEEFLREHVCPEKKASILSRIYFTWMTPLMQQGYKNPITEKDIWSLDDWDRTVILSKKFQSSWEEEAKRSKPWLLRALNRSLGGRFWFGGFFKIGDDLSQLAGPVLLNHLLKSLEGGGIQRGLDTSMHSQFFLSVVAAKITNMITTDANSLQGHADTNVACVHR